MRICYLNHDLERGTGAGNFCLSLMAAVREIAPGYQLEVLTFQDVLAAGWLASVLNLPRIRSVLQRGDIIHALDGWPYGFIAAACSLGLNKKVVITAVGTGAVQPLYHTGRRRLMIWAYKKAHRVTAVSNNTKREILKIIPDLNVEVINHGVDMEKFKIQNSKFKTTIQNLKPYVLSVGTLKKRKGYEHSIRAFAEIAKDFPGLKYVIVGQGPERENIQLLITNYQLQNRVVVFSKVEEGFLVALYQNAELFILMPHDDKKDIEGFGLVFLEAAACGLPVIGTKNSGATDAIVPGVNGYLVEPDNTGEAAAAISKILSRKELRQKLSRGSAEFVRHMGWNISADKYVSCYQALLNRSV